MPPVGADVRPVPVMLPPGARYQAVSVNPTTQDLQRYKRCLCAFFEQVRLVFGGPPMRRNGTLTSFSGVLLSPCVNPMSWKEGGSAAVEKPARALEGIGLRPWTEYMRCLRL